MRSFHLEDSMVMYGIYNSDTLEDLIDTGHRLHNKTIWNERLFAGQIKIGIIGTYLQKVQIIMQ